VYYRSCSCANRQPQPRNFDVCLPAPRSCASSDNLRSMAINFKDGVILAADSRTTTGAYIANRVTDKLTQVHDTIWCCRSGSAADTQAVADIVHYHLGMYGTTNDEPPTTQTAAAIFQELCYSNKDSLSYVAPTSQDALSDISPAQA
jgi:20S proteasome alpha/beta subunit